MANFFAELKRRYIYSSAEEPRVGRRLAAIFAADVAGYSRLMGQDEAGTVRALSAARATLGCLVAENGGRIVNSVGDSVLAEFPSAVDAVKCAMAVQERLAQAEAGPRLPFRIAVHVGDVLPSGADIYGDGINVCARLQEVAEPGGICVSGAAYQYIRKVLPLTFDDLGEKILKNIDEPVRVFAIRAAREPEHSPPRPKPSAAPDLTVAPRQAKVRTLGWIAVGGLAAAMALFLVYQFAPPDGTTPAQQTGVEAARLASISPARAIAVAVMPFENLSSDKEQEFFSDGITDEISGALAKIPDLRVVARSSAFKFKGQNEEARVMGQALGATHLIEGSVRKAGNRVRISAELVQVDNGLQVWSSSYDRDLTDVFAIQEDIARAIAASLRMPLGLKPGENLVNNRSIDPESYEKVLRARALLDARITGTGPTGAAAIYEEVTTKNPGYAPAWGLLAGAYFLIGTAHSGNINLPIAESRERADAFRAKGEAAAQRGLQADHDLARGYFESALFAWSRAKPLEAQELFNKGLSLDPLAPNVLDAYAIRLGAAGRVKDALAVVEKARAVEPFLPALSLRYAQDLWLDRQDDAAIAQAKTLRPVDRAPTLAMMYAALGRYGEAADALMEVASDPNSAAAQAARLLRTAPAKAPSPDKLPRLPADLEFVFLHVGAPERALYTYERRAEVGFLAGGPTAYVWHPSYAPVRKTERFKTLMRKAGLVEYWRAKGWPAQCHPTTGDDFACN